jgi:MFS transporter, ACS family, hexuronate transporter
VTEEAPRSNLRWVVLALLFGSTVLNYVDRQALSILASTVQLDLKMTDQDYANVVQLFLIAYTLAYLLSGRIADWLGARVGLALFVGWWSIANIVTGLVTSTAQLGAARFALGLGEAGNWTVGPKVISEHFQPKERAFAYGLYTSGAMVGAILAPPLLGGLALTFGWRSAFFVTGVLGLVWLAFWLKFYKSAMRAEESKTEPALKEQIVWAAIVRDPRIWLLALARAVADPVWYFYLFWFPKYLTDQRGLTLLVVAQLAWIVYLAADFGSIGGGFLSGRLVKRGFSPVRARLTIMAVAACLAPFGALVATGPTLPVAFALGSIVALAHLAFQVNVSTLVVDLYPTRVVATVFGVIAAGSGIGGIVSTQVISHLVVASDYGPVFLLMGCLHPIAFAIAWAATKMASRSRVFDLGAKAG